MPRPLSRRHAIAALLSASGSAVAFFSGCSDSVPNQRTSGTMVVPLESIEKADEIEAKKREALSSKKGKKKGG